ncbi:hypothetical protein RN001_010244 [Aquatica leii]|uniref:Lipase domain-containing protein n=1 Tax=Aquatica leii TaxID=1421715 RepID=A0AAN7SN84_9COLE|nr:hypothetical protein RN001_010244 [Aquatica leii]
MFSFIIALPQMNPNYIVFEDENGKVYYEDVSENVFKQLAYSDLRLFLYTRNNSQFGHEVSMTSLTMLKNSKLFQTTKENYFIIHGWKNSYMSEISVTIKNAILTTADFNVFLVDWGNMARYSYLFSYSVVPEVGKSVATFINDMIASFKLSPKMFMLVGHSIGAHIAGCIGASVDGSVKYIVGLDPAGPLYTSGSKQIRLDADDADFVQVIHTSINLLGFKDAIGHADYYPNGGKYQPGCLEIIGGCSHGRAYKYFVESILRGGFSAVHCEDYERFKTSMCTNGRKSYLGQVNLDTSARGEYYLDTNSESPFSLDCYKQNR